MSISAQQVLTDTVREQDKQMYKAGVSCNAMEQYSGKFVSSWWNESLLK